MDAFFITDIVLIIGISQGLFLAIAIYSITNKNKEANNILSIVLLMASLMLFGRMALDKIEAKWIYHIAILVDTTVFLFGPLIYIYLRRLNFFETSKFKLGWWHYLPALLHLMYFFWTLSFSTEEFSVLFFSGKLNLISFVVIAAGLLSFTFYLFKSGILIKKYREIEKKELSYRQGVFKFSVILLFTCALLTLLWWISFIKTNFFAQRFRLFNYELMWIFTPSFIYIIGFYALRQPEIFRLKLDYANARPKKDRLKPEEIKKLKERLMYFINVEHLYTKPDLSLKILADEMNTSTNNLSWLLNEVFQYNFNDFINMYRIQAFIKKVNQGEHLKNTFFALALEVGFNSKSTFNKAFKLVTGETPSSYIKKNKGEHLEI